MFWLVANVILSWYFLLLLLLRYGLRWLGFACFPYPSIVSLLCCCTTTKQNQKTNAHHESEIKINVTRRRRQPSAGQPGSLLPVYGHQQSLDMYNLTAAELNEILFRRCVQDWLKPFTKLTDWQTSKPATEKKQEQKQKNEFFSYPFFYKMIWDFVEANALNK